MDKFSENYQCVLVCYIIVATYENYFYLYCPRRTLVWFQPCKLLVGFGLCLGFVLLYARLTSSLGLQKATTIETHQSRPCPVERSL
jgi:hypothetical protein